MRKHFRRILSAAGIVTLAGAGATANTLQWTGAVSSDITDGANWLGGAPPIGGAADVWIFNSSATRFDPLFPTEAPFPSHAYSYVDRIQVDSGAFTFQGVDSTARFDNFASTYPMFVNNSPLTQTFNINVGAYSTSTERFDLVATNGDIVVNGDLLAAQDDTRTSRIAVFAGDHDIYLSKLVRNATATDGRVGRIVYRGGGHLILRDSGTVYGGNIESRGTGVIRATNINSFASTAGATSVIGGTTFSGNVELALGVSTTNNLAEPFLFDARNGLVANAPHFVSASGNNTITSDLQMTTLAGGGSINIESRGVAAGDLLSFSGNYAHVGAGTTDVLSLGGAGNGVFSGNITQTSGVWNVVKTGAGRWTLGGASNSYTGNTTVQGGVLLLTSASSVATSSSINVQSGASLDISALPGGYIVPDAQPFGGAGTVIGSVTVGAGTLRPGDATNGPLTITGNLSINGGGTVALDLSNDVAGANDKVVVGGNLTLAGNTTLAVTRSAGILGPGTYRLFDYTGSLTGNLSNLTLTGASAGPNARPQTFALDNSVAHQINLNVVGGAAHLTWVGGNNSNAWDLLTTPNWTGAPGPSPDNRFYEADEVTFSNTGASPDINVSGTVSPSAFFLTNNVGHDYSFNGGTVNVLGSALVSGSGNASFTGAGFQIAGNLTMNGTGTLSVSAATFAVGRAIALNSGTLELNLPADGTFTTPLSGSGALRKAGSSTLTLARNNSGFSGPIFVAGGKLILGNDTALGASPSVTVSTGAALDLMGAVNTTTAAFSIAGDGTDSNGALLNSNSRFVHVKTLNLTSDATVGVGTNSTPSGFVVDNSLNASGHALALKLMGGAKTEVDLIDLGATNLTNLNVNSDGNGGIVYVGGSTTLGNPSGVVTVGDNVKISFLATSLVHSKPIALGNTAVELNLTRSNPSAINGITVASPITLNGTAEFTFFNGSDGQKFELSGPISGGGQLAVHSPEGAVGTGAVVLTSNNNTYTGGTHVGGGTGNPQISLSSTQDHAVLMIGNGGTSGVLGPGDVEVDETGTLAFNRSDSITMSNPIGGTQGGTVAVLLGHVTFTGNNSFTGVTIVNGGIAEFAPNAQGPVLTDLTSQGADIQRGRLVYQYVGSSVAGTVQGLLAHSFANGFVRPAGNTDFLITSSTATADRGLGMLDTGASVVVAPALYGDANLDGKVNALDFNALATHFGASNVFWYQGDFNYDGVVNTMDFNMLAAHFNQSISPAPALGTLVPEPTILPLATLCALGLKRRRGR